MERGEGQFREFTGSIAVFLSIPLSAPPLRFFTQRSPLYRFPSTISLSLYVQRSLLSLLLARPNPLCDSTDQSIVRRRRRAKCWRCSTDRWRSARRRSRARSSTRGRPPPRRSRTAPSATTSPPPTRPRSTSTSARPACWPTPSIGRTLSSPGLSLPHPPRRIVSHSRGSFRVFFLLVSFFAIVLRDREGDCVHGSQYFVAGSRPDQ